MVQTLATMLMTYVQRPSLQHCGTVAQSLIENYDFLKDDDGDGEVSIAFERRVTVVVLPVCLCVCLLSHTLPLEHLCVLKILPHTQQATEVEKFVGFSLKPFYSRVMA